jgi:hypothetical protein
VWRLITHSASQGARIVSIRATASAASARRPCARIACARSKYQMGAGLGGLALECEPIRARAEMDEPRGLVGPRGST